MSADYSNFHTHRSSYRESVVEHRLLSDLLGIAWSRGVLLEVSRAEVDAFGYDLILTVGDVTRHVQVKASMTGGKTSKQGINVTLEEKPSGCVVWVVNDQESTGLVPNHYLFYGDQPGTRLPALDGKATKKAGRPGVRQNTRDVTKRQFDLVEGADKLLTRLFGAAAA